MQFYSVGDVVRLLSPSGQPIVDMGVVDATMATGNPGKYQILSGRVLVVYPNGGNSNWTIGALHTGIPSYWFNYVDPICGLIED